MGNLNIARSGHSVIYVENEFIVAGGINSFGPQDKGLKSVPTESCKLNGQSSMTCTTREPVLTQFTAYPGMIVL